MGARRRSSFCTMSKTIDVGGPSPSHWPPRGTGGSGKGRFDIPKPPAIFQVAGILLVLFVIAALVLASKGGLGVTRVQANEIAVRVNYLTGGEEVITQPGYQFYIPYIQSIQKLDRTLQEYVMEGNTRGEGRKINRADQLTVRANDGSNFWFKLLKIQYELTPGEGSRVLTDSGPGEQFKLEWIKAYARSILRDEFGRFSAVEVANPTVYKHAPEVARERMNKILEPHGIKIVRIITPNPKFDARYETAIEDRKEADQMVEELKARADQLVQLREQRLAAVRKEKEVEMQSLEGDLVMALRNSERQAIQITRGADAFTAERVAEGQAEREHLLANAEGLTAKYTKEAEGIQSRALALEQRGEVVVREALIQKLLGVRFTFVPYSKDPAPKRLEHSGSPDSVDRRSQVGGER